MHDPDPIIEIRLANSFRMKYNQVAILAKEKGSEGYMLLTCNIKTSMPFLSLYSFLKIFLSISYSNRSRSAAKSQALGAAVNTKGASLGRPTTTIENLPELFIRHYPKYAAKQITQEELARLCDVSRQSISKYIKVWNQGA